jgi:sugar-specific transcriptional regulator TrmB
MIIQAELLNKLKAFGLNTYEAKLWMALLSRGVSTAGELSDIANVPRSRSYDVLESLEKKGFIMMKLGKPIKYVAVKPSEVLDRVKKRIENEAQTQTRMIDNIKNSEVLEELRLLHSQGIQTVDPGDLTGSLKGQSNIYTHVSSAIKNAEKSVIVMATDEELVRYVDHLKKAFSRAHKNDVSIRIAVPISDVSQEAVDILSEYADIKHLDTITARFIIVDDRDITFMLTDDKKVHSNYDVGIWASSDFFCLSMKNLFENVWKTLEGKEQDIPAEEAVKALN